MRHRTRAALAAAAALLAAGSPGAEAAGKSLPISLKLHLNQTCIAPANAVLVGSCDGDTFSSYVEESMPDAGSLEVGGTTFDWAGSGLGAKDVVLAAGQPVTVPGAPRGYKSVAALMAAHSTNYKATLTVTYTDGSKDVLPITLVDWKAKKGSALKGVRTQWVADAFSSMAYPGEGAIGLVVAPINKKKAVQSVTLPSASNRALVFALSLSSVTSAPA